MAAAQKVKDCLLLDKRTSSPLGAQLWRLKVHGRRDASNYSERT
jgi:hypothetical protein